MAIDFGRGEFTIDITDLATENIKRINQSVKTLSIGMEEVTKTVSAVNNKTKKTNDLFSTVTKRTRGFRAELLSFVFVGMQVNAFFAEYINAANQMSGTTEMLQTSIGAAVLAFQDFIGITGFKEAIADFADQNELLVGGFTLAGSAVGTLIEKMAQIGIIASTWKDLKDTMSVLLPVFKDFGGLSFWGKLGMIALSIGILVAGFYLVYDGIQRIIKASGIFDKIMGWVQIIAAVVGVIAFFMGGWVIAIGAAVIAVIAFASKWEPVKTAILWIWDALKAIGSLIKGLFTGDFTGVGTKFKKLIGLQEGGVVTRPTAALIGERGPEAVIPLSRLTNFAPSVTINTNVSNDVDISRLADRLGSIYAQQLNSLGLNRRIA